MVLIASVHRHCLCCTLYVNLRYCFTFSYSIFFQVYSGTPYHYDTGNDLLGTFCGVARPPLTTVFTSPATILYHTNNTRNGQSFEAVFNVKGKFHIILPQRPLSNNLEFSIYLSLQSRFKGCCGGERIVFVAPCISTVRIIFR